MRDWAHSRRLGIPADEAGSVVLRQPPASKLANLFRIDVRDHALGLVTQQVGGRVREQPPGGWLGPRTPSLREGPGSASVPTGSPAPVAGTGAQFWGTSHRSRGKTGLTTQENECEKGKLRLRENRRTGSGTRLGQRLRRARTRPQGSTLIPAISRFPGPTPLARSKLSDTMPGRERIDEVIVEGARLVVQEQGR